MRYSRKTWKLSTSLNIPVAIEMISASVVERYAPLFLGLPKHRECCISCGDLHPRSTCALCRTLTRSKVSVRINVQSGHHIGSYLPLQNEVFGAIDVRDDSMQLSVLEPSPRCYTACQSRRDKRQIGPCHKTRIKIREASCCNSPA